MERIKFLARKPFLGKKTRVTNLTKNVKYDWCLRNHVYKTYFLMQFSGYIANAVRFYIVYVFLEVIYL